MTSVSEISVVRVPPPGDEHAGEPTLGPTLATWAPVEIPRGSRPSPVALALLALLAGIGAMVLGALALVAATQSGDAATTTPLPAATPAPTIVQAPEAERRVLALLAKPSTERIVFRGSGGRLLLVVGSGGKAAILLRGFERAPGGRPYTAWVVRSGRAARAATFTGTERAVFLSGAVRPGTSVVVAVDRAAALRQRAGRIVAVRG